MEGTRWGEMHEDPRHEDAGIGDEIRHSEHGHVELPFGAPAVSQFSYLPTYRHMRGFLDQVFGLS